MHTRLLECLTVLWPTEHRDAKQRNFDLSWMPNEVLKANVTARFPILDGYFSHPTMHLKHAIICPRPNKKCTFST